MKQSSYIHWALAGLSLALLSCTTEEREPELEAQRLVPAEIEVTINELVQPATRANVDASDSWTTRSFSANDKIGLMATNGIVPPVDQAGKVQANWLKNDFMEYYQASGSSNYRFRNEDLLINTSLLTGKEARYVYFPYTDEMPVPYFDKTQSDIHDETAKSKGGNPSYGNGSDYFRAFANPMNQNSLAEGFKNKQGMKLRRPVDGIDRCVDYMYISNINMTSGALSGGFYHGFCELVILRGTGFENPQPEHDEIRVVLSDSFTRLTLNLHYNKETGQYSFIPRLWPGATNWETWSKDISGDPTGKEVDGLTQEEAKKWQAWKGQDYLTTKDDLPVARDAWYVIMPTATSYSNPTVEYIEIWDNDGKECRVSNFDLYINPETGVADKIVRAGYRFAVEVMMTELGATARPVEISEWSDDDGQGGELGNDITDIRSVGIKDYIQYNEWVTAYNYFIYQNPTRPTTPEGLSSMPNYEKLSEFGDYNLDEGRWQFYITGDFEIEPGATQIHELQDLLEGVSQVSTFTLSKLTQPLVGTIAANGELRNLSFNNLYIKANGTDPQGALANTLLANGKITNCTVDGTMIGSAEAYIGLLCGAVSGGEISKCKVSGAVIGPTAEAPYAGVFGKVTVPPSTYDVTTTGLIVRPL